MKLILSSFQVLHILTTRGFNKNIYLLLVQEKLEFSFKLKTWIFILLSVLIPDWLSTFFWYGSFFMFCSLKVIDKWKSIRKHAPVAELPRLGHKSTQIVLSVMSWCADVSSHTVHDKIYNKWTKKLGKDSFDKPSTELHKPTNFILLFYLHFWIKTSDKFCFITTADFSYW